MRMRAGIFFFPGDGAPGADRRDEEPLSAKAYRMGRCQTTLPLGQDLPREAAVELAAEEVEDVLGEQTERGMAQQPPVEGAQGGATREQDVGGVLGLVRRPVVAIARELVAQERIDPGGEAVEPGSPIQRGEAVTWRARRGPRCRVHRRA